MGSEGESSDFNLPVHVAVGKNVKEGKLLLEWAARNFEGRDICLVHVHHPTNLLKLYWNLSASKLKNQAIKTIHEFDRPKMQKLLNEYLDFLSKMGIQADKVWTETSKIEEGILQLISKHRIKQLIMGAPTAEEFCTKKLSEINSSKAMIVCQQSPLSCHIWIICNGSLIYRRPANSGSHLFSTVALTSSPNSGGTPSTDDPKENMDVSAVNLQCFEQPSKSREKFVDRTNSTSLAVGQTSGDGSSLLLKVKSPEHLPLSSSNASQDYEVQDLEPSDLRVKLEHAMVDMENARQGAFEESLKRWRAEEDAYEAQRKAEAAESLWRDEMRRNKEIEELIIKQRQNMEIMKIQHNQFITELQSIHDQKPALESQLTEADWSEKELEAKIIQAVNLLIKFKDARDKLQTEYDSTSREINKLRMLQMEAPTGISGAQCFGISFSDIIEATQNFSPSQKIGEGRHTSVFKGILYHAKVAIKMLPSSGSQSDSDFKHEAQVLSRVRHPNLVTLIGACPESRSLIYEYMENGSLEDYLSGAKTRHFSWQLRIRIAVDTCSALLFLHANNGCVHGNLKPSNILFDSNFTSKISDFGINSLISNNENPSNCHTFCTKNDPQISAYIDPEASENGELTTESDIYSFGIVTLRLLTARPAAGVVRDVKCALERGNLDSVLDISAGDWPLEQAKQLATLALRCCEKNRFNRPDLVSEFWTVLEPMREVANLSELTSTSSCSKSRSQHKIPSHFVCPIFQEVMTDPHIAGDGFTYEGDAIKGWFNSGHKTSPMTNLKLENCDLIPNYALLYAIQEWQQNT